jgi:hypothetical protein
VPASCRVTGVIKPSSDSNILFEVWLPAAGAATRVTTRIGTMTVTRRTESSQALWGGLVPALSRGSRFAQLYQRRPRLSAITSLFGIPARRRQLTSLEA